MNHHIFAMLFGGVLVLLLFAGGAFGAGGWWNTGQYRHASNTTIYNYGKPLVESGSNASAMIKNPSFWWNASWHYRKPINITEQSGNNLTNYQVAINISYDSDMQPDFSDLRFTYYLDWKYRIPITITENSGQNLTDYQVNITINTQSLITQGKMRSDCGDIRFFDENGNYIPYWIESGCGTTSTVIWVKVPKIPANSTTTVYMYYGNPDATSESNATNVFDLFDDFYTIDTTTLWNKKGSPSPYVVSGTDYIDLNGDSWCASGIISKSTYDLPLAVRFRIRRTRTTYSAYEIIAEGGAGLHRGMETSGVCAGQNSLGYATVGIGGETGSLDYNIYYSFQNSSGWNHYITVEGGNDGDWHTFEIVAYDNTIKWYKDNSLVGSTTTDTPESSVYIGFFGRSHYTAGANVDWVALRKYIDPEPLVSIGTEQSRGFYISLMTDKANYSTGEVINLMIEVNRTQEYPQVMKFRLELEDLDDKPDVLIETGSFVMPAKFHKKVVLRFAIPESPFVPSGRYAFKAYLIEPSLGEVLAYDFIYFNVKEKEAKAKEQQSEAFAAFSLVEG